MNRANTIKCAFCAGRGTNPFYKGTCPVCKGRGENEVIVPFVVCSECKGDGKKSGTTLTCFECRGIGVVADTREDIEKARSEIREIQKEMAEEQSELYGKINKKAIKTRSARRQAESLKTPLGWPNGLPRGGETKRASRPVKEMKRRKFDKIFAGREASFGKYFCQSCAKEESLGSAYKVCEECFFLYKFGEVREIKLKEEDEG